MPQIIVTAGVASGAEEDVVTLRERINITDFESERFTANLLERLGWAVSDATDVERSTPAPNPDETDEGEHEPAPADNELVYS